MLRVANSDVRARVLPVANPLSEEQSVMRTTLVPGLLEVARHNVARDMPDLSLFECGRVFFSKGRDDPPDERLHLGRPARGRLPAGDVAAARAPGRLLHGQGVLVALLEALGVAGA